MKIIRLLIEAGADLETRNHYGWTPLMQAVLEGSTDQVKVLLVAGANPNVAFPQHTEPIFLRDNTLLMLAVSSEDKLRLLLKAGADVRTEGRNGQTVLEYAKLLLTESNREAYKAEVLRSITLLQNAIKSGVLPSRAFRLN